MKCGSVGRGEKVKDAILGMAGNILLSGDPTVACFRQSALQRDRLSGRSRLSAGWGQHPTQRAEMMSHDACEH